MSPTRLLTKILKGTSHLCGWHVMDKPKQGFLCHMEARFAVAAHKSTFSAEHAVTDLSKNMGSCHKVLQLQDLKVMVCHQPLSHTMKALMEIKCTCTWPTTEQ